MTLSLLLTVFTGSFVAAPAGASDDDSFEVVECEEIDTTSDTVSLVCMTLVGIMAEDGQNWHQFRQFQGQSCHLTGVCIEGQAKMGFGEGCDGSGDVCLELTGKVAAEAPVEPGEIQSATLTHMDDISCSWDVAGGCGGPFTDGGVPVHLHYHSMSSGWQCHDLNANALGHVTAGNPSISGETCYKYGPLDDITG